MSTMGCGYGFDQHEASQTDSERGQKGQHGNAANPRSCASDIARAKADKAPPINERAGVVEGFGLLVGFRGGR